VSRLAILLPLVLALHAPAAWPLTAAQVYAIAAKSVVVVESLSQSKRRAQGSGVVVGNGEVVTNCHVVLFADKIVVRSGTAQHEARRRYADSERDLCVLQVPTLKLAAAPANGSANPGDRVFAIGAPQGLELSISEGLVSGLRQINNLSVVQTTAAISRGSSGGGLFDESGRLIGITTMQARSGQNLNFAVPARYIAEIPERHARAQRTLSSTAFSADDAGAQRPGLAETAAFIEESLRAYGRFTSLPPLEGAKVEMLLHAAAMRECRLLLEREVQWIWETASPPTRKSQLFADTVRLNTRDIALAPPEPGQGITLQSSRATPLAVRRSIQPREPDSAENRIVIYVGEEAAAMRVRNALAHAIALCRDRTETQAGK